MEASGGFVNCRTKVQHPWPSLLRGDVKPLWDLQKVSISDFSLLALQAIGTCVDQDRKHCVNRSRAADFVKWETIPAGLSTMNMETRQHPAEVLKASPDSSKPAVLGFKAPRAVYSSTVGMSQRGASQDRSRDCTSNGAAGVFLSGCTCLCFSGSGPAKCQPPPGIQAQWSRMPYFSSTYLLCLWKSRVQCDVSC